MWGSAPLGRAGEGGSLGAGADGRGVPGVLWGEGTGLPGGEQHSQAVCGPRQHLHSLVQHLEAALPVAEVRVAVEEQAVERGPERQVVLGTYSGRGTARLGRHRELSQQHLRAPS